MIDELLIRRAVPASNILNESNRAWRKFMKIKLSKIVRMPFSGSYECAVKEKYIRVEGYRGPLLIDRICDGMLTYVLTTPIKVEDYRICGLFDKTGGRFLQFSAFPVIGFHLTGMTSENDTGLCTGHLEYNNPSTIEGLREICGRIADSLRVIYTLSLGTIIVPEEHAYLKHAFHDHSWERSRVGLINDKLISPLLYDVPGTSGFIYSLYNRREDCVLEMREITRMVHNPHFSPPLPLTALQRIRRAARRERAEAEVLRGAAVPEGVPVRWVTADTIVEGADIGTTGTTTFVLNDLTT